MTLTTDGMNIDLIESFIQVLWDRGGTDLLVTARSPMRMRVDSMLTPIEGAATLDEEQASALVTQVIGEKYTATLREQKEVDFSFAWHDKARFRGNAFHQQGGYAMSLRMIPNHVPSFQELNLPEAIERFARLPQGLVLVTGPTGSGKSTTLASIIDHINTHRACHILTIEDPIEYVHDHKRAAVNQREVGVDTESFGTALRSALREDPDVILVGEMRDLETIQFALTIAETGHLVFATLHTNDAAQALDRISDVFPANRQEQIKVQLAAAIQGVVSQRLIPKTSGGMVAAFEVLIANNAMRNLIREGKTHQIRNVVATSMGQGMRTLEASLSELCAAGHISYEEAVARSLFPKEVRRPQDHAAWMQRQMQRDEANGQGLVALG
jgi:twitching motility protein PilT